MYIATGYILCFYITKTLQKKTMIFIIAFEWLFIISIHKSGRCFFFTFNYFSSKMEILIIDGMNKEVMNQYEKNKVEINQFISKN